MKSKSVNRAGDYWLSKRKDRNVFYITSYCKETRQTKYKTTGTTCKKQALLKLSKHYNTERESRHMLSLEKRKAYNKKDKHLRKWRDKATAEVSNYFKLRNKSNKCNSIRSLEDMIVSRKPSEKGYYNQYHKRHPYEAQYMNALYMLRYIMFDKLYTAYNALKLSLIINKYWCLTGASSESFCKKTFNKIYMCNQIKKNDIVVINDNYEIVCLRLMAKYAINKPRYGVQCSSIPFEFKL